MKPKLNNSVTTSLTFSTGTSPSYGQPITHDTYPLIFKLFSLAILTTDSNLYKDSFYIIVIV